MPTRKPSLITFGFAVLAVLPVLYVGAYYLPTGWPRCPATSIVLSLRVSL